MQLIMYFTIDGNNSSSSQTTSMSFWLYQTCLRVPSVIQSHIVLLSAVAKLKQSHKCWFTIGSALVIIPPYIFSVETVSLVLILNTFNFLWTRLNHTFLKSFLIAHLLVEEKKQKVFLFFLFLCCAMLQSSLNCSNLKIKTSEQCVVSVQS